MIWKTKETSKTFWPFLSSPCSCSLSCNHGDDDVVRRIIAILRVIVFYSLINSLLWKWYFYRVQKNSRRTMPQLRMKYNIRRLSTVSDKFITSYVVVSIRNGEAFFFGIFERITKLGSDFVSVEWRLLSMKKIFFRSLRYLRFFAFWFEVSNIFYGMGEGGVMRSFNWKVSF